MPNFSNSCNVQNCAKHLSHEELIRGIRFNISAEYEAVQLYEQIKEATDNELVKTVLTDIANEEKEHAGELLKLLTVLEPDESKFYEEGANEVEQMMQKLNQNSKKGEK